MKFKDSRLENTALKHADFGGGVYRLQMKALEANVRHAQPWLRRLSAEAAHV